MKKDFSRVINNKEIQKAINQLDKKGFTKINNFLKKKYIIFFLNEINKSQSKSNNQNTIFNLQNLNHKFIQLINNNYIKKILINKLNDPYYRSIPKNKPNYSLKLLTARSSKKKLDLHIDTYFPFKGKKTFMLQVVILLEDSNLNNGCTTIVEKSHLSGKYSDRKSKKISYLQGKAGDVLIWDSRLWHGANKNKTKKSRWAIIATFGCWWVKPFMDIPKSVPQKIYEKCNNEEKSILGFCSLTPINEKQSISSKFGYRILKKKVNSFW